MSDGFRTLVVDPPWKFKDQGSRISPVYPLMEVAEIAAMPVGDIADASAHLYLWCPMAFTEDAHRIAKGWGFRYVLDVEWIKTTDDGSKVRFGAGHYFRHAVEKALFCTRGQCPPLRHDVSNVFFAPRTIHSAKPDKFYEIVETVSPDPRIDIFARKHRAGWEVFGNEV